MERLESQEVTRNSIEDPRPDQISKMSRHPNSFSFHGTASSSSSASASSSSSIWSSPNIGQMTEMSQDWYRKMMNDSAELIRVSLESQYKDMELSEFISHSQPQPLQVNYYSSSQQTIDNFPFNSLPNQDLPDIPDLTLFFGGAALFTPEPTREASKETSSSITSNPGSVKPQLSQNILNHQAPRGRRYHNTNLLAQYCQEILAITAHPSISQIDGIVDKLKEPEESNHVTRCKKLRSSIREWFRKRREYMATKVYKSCQRLLPSVAPDEKEEIDKFIKKIHKNSSLIGIIMLESHLPMASEKEKIAFVKEKIVDFYMKYPARRRRNLTNFKKRNLYDEFAYEDEIEFINLSQDDVNSLLNK
jgi:hypothetical protein